MAKKKDSVVMHEQDLQQVSAQQRMVQIFVKAMVYLFLGVMALIVLFPFYWMIISSLKDLAEYRLTVPTLWPQKFVFANYADAFEKANLAQLFLNTVCIQRHGTKAIFLFYLAENAHSLRPQHLQIAVTQG